MNKTAKAFLIFILAVFLLPFQAKAATITPPRIEASGDPGQTASGQVKLYNDKTTAQTFYIIVQDFQAKDETGNPQFVTTPDGLDSWIKVQPSVVLAPKEEKRIPFIVTIPKAADPGGYFAAIFATTQPPQTAQGGQVALTSQVGTLIFLRVNGNIPESTSILEFSTTDHGRFYVRLPIGFFYRFQNSGSDRVLPLGDIIIKNTIGRTTKILKANPTQGNVLPKSIRRFESTWDTAYGDVNQDPLVMALATPGHGFWNAVRYEWNNFAFGFYRANLNLAYGNVSTQTANAQYSFFVFPWQLLLVIVIILIALLIVLRFALRRYNRHIINKAKRKK